MVKQASKEAINKSKHQFKKSLGQNFLQNHHIVKKIADLINNDVDGIIEIGPGIGALTQELLKLAKPTLCVELDDNLIDKLNHQFADNVNFSLMHMDCLKLNETIINNHFGIKQLALVANIPYYITSAIITMYIEKLTTVKTAILMVQKEVAKRICATPKQKAYGSLSVFCQTFCDVKLEFLVKKENFYPQPKVDSAIIQLIKHDVDIDKELYSQFLQACFHQKRKTLVNNLVHATKLEKQKIITFLESYHICITARAEELEVHEFIQLFDGYQQLIKED